MLSLPIPNYEAVLKQHLHLRNRIMNHTVKKIELSVHLIFDANDYTKAKVQEMPWVRPPSEPVSQWQN